LIDELTNQGRLADVGGTAGLLRLLSEPDDDARWEDLACLLLDVVGRNLERRLWLAQRMNETQPSEETRFEIIAAMTARQAFGAPGAIGESWVLPPEPPVPIRGRPGGYRSPNKDSDSFIIPISSGEPWPVRDGTIYRLAGSGDNAHDVVVLKLPELVCQLVRRNRKKQITSRLYVLRDPDGVEHPIRHSALVDPKSWESWSDPILADPKVLHALAYAVQYMAKSVDMFDERWCWRDGQLQSVPEGYGPDGYGERSPFSDVECWEAWHKILTIGANHPKFALVAGSGLGGLYLEPLGRARFVLNLISELSSQAKSTAQHTGAGELGWPGPNPLTPEGAFWVMNAAPGGLEAKIGGLGCLPAFIDELGAAGYTPDQLESWIMRQASAGGGRIRGSRIADDFSEGSHHGSLIVVSSNKTPVSAKRSDGISPRAIKVWGPMIGPVKNREAAKQATEIANLVAAAYGYPLSRVLAGEVSLEHVRELLTEADLALDIGRGEVLGRVAMSLAVLVAGARLLAEMFDVPVFADAALRGALKVLAEAEADRLVTATTCGALFIELVLEGIASRRAAWPTLEEMEGEEQLSKGETLYNATGKSVDLPKRYSLKDREGVQLPEGILVFTKAGNDIMHEAGIDKLMVLRELKNGDGEWHLRTRKDPDHPYRYGLSLPGIKELVYGYMLVKTGNTGNGGVSDPETSRSEAETFISGKPEMGEPTKPTPETISGKPEIAALQEMSRSEAQDGQIPEPVSGFSGFSEISPIEVDHAAHTTNLSHEAIDPPLDLGELPLDTPECVELLRGLDLIGLRSWAKQWTVAGYLTARQRTRIRRRIEIDTGSRWPPPDDDDPDPSNDGDPNNDGEDDVQRDGEDDVPDAATPPMVTTKPAEVPSVSNRPHKTAPSSTAKPEPHGAKPGSRYRADSPRSRVLDADLDGLVLLAPGEPARRVDKLSGLGKLLHLALEAEANPLEVTATAMKVIGITGKELLESDSFAVAPDWDVRTRKGDGRVFALLGEAGTPGRPSVRVIWAPSDKRFGKLASGPSILASLEKFETAHGGTAPQGSGRADFKELLTRSHNSITGRKLTKLISTESIEPEWIAKVGLSGEAGALSWDREPGADGAKSTHGHALDRNGDFLTALRESRVPIGAPEHLTGRFAFDPGEKRPGWWEIAPPTAWPHELPYLATSDGRFIADTRRHRVGDPVRITTVTARFIVKELGIPLVVVDAWVWPESCEYLRPVADVLRDARADLVTATSPEGITAYKAHKDVYSEWINDLSAQFHEPDLVTKDGLTRGPRWWSPTLHAHIVAGARVARVRSVRKAALTSGIWPAAMGGTDQVFYFSTEPDPERFAKRVGLSIGSGLGEWKHAGSGALPNDFAALEYRPGRLLALLDTLTGKAHDGH
jgi:hypothetical protein